MQTKFSFETDIQFDNILSSGQKVQYSAFQRFYVQRPNRLRVDYTGDLRATRFFFDGQTMTFQDADGLFYVTRPMAGTIDDAIAAVNQELGFNIPLSNLLARDPYQAIAPTITNIRYLGMGMVNRVPAHHLLYQIGERDVQVWIRDGREPTMQKIVINYHQLPGSPQYTAIFSQWNFNPQFSASLFEFRPPVGVGKINRFSEYYDETDETMLPGNYYRVHGVPGVGAGDTPGIRLGGGTAAGWCGCPSQYTTGEPSGGESPIHRECAEYQSQSGGRFSPESG